MEQKSNGALFGSIVIIIILVIGGFYIWITAVKERTLKQNNNIVPTEESNVPASKTP